LENSEAVLVNEPEELPPRDTRRRRQSPDVAPDPVDAGEEKPGHPEEDHQVNPFKKQTDKEKKKEEMKDHVKKRQGVEKPELTDDPVLVVVPKVKPVGEIGQTRPQLEIHDPVVEAKPKTEDLPERRRRRQAGGEQPVKPDNKPPPAVGQNRPLPLPEIQGLPVETKPAPAVEVNPARRRQAVDKGEEEVENIKRLSFCFSLMPCQNKLECLVAGKLFQVSLSAYSPSFRNDYFFITYLKFGIKHSIKHSLESVLINSLKIV